MDSGTSFGSSIDNIIAPAFARKRTGWSLVTTSQEDIPIGLNDFLQLCQTLGTEPWYSMPAGTSPKEAKHLIEYLAGSSTTPYGAKRAASGQIAPWTSVFPIIHLELGNEQWNGPTFYGASIYDAAAFGQRASDVYAAARSSAAYNAAKFDLILGSFAVVPSWTKQQLANSAGYDSVAVAPYLFNEFNDASSNEAIFGPMFAEPEMIDSTPSGFMAQQSKAAKEASHPATLAIYEVNLSSTQGTVSQSTLNSTIPSLGAGLAVADHMLLMMRDLGVTTQAVFGLSEFTNRFNNTNSPGTDQSVPLWGIVVDMGGPTNLRRPQFLAEQLANDAILPVMVDTTLTGANPTWNQRVSTNDKIKLEKAHLLQTFAFVDGIHHSLIVFNLSRDRALPITFSGAAAPTGTVAFSQLTAAKITDTNEFNENVAIKRTTLNGFNPKLPYSVPPFSMNVFKWDTLQNAPSTASKVPPR
jgi:alpha-L-arabinofuranosidase